MIRGREPAQEDRALLLILHTQCAFCTESLPFVHSIETERKVRKQDLRIYVLTREDPAVMKEYVRRHGLSVDAVVQVSRSAIRSAGFPTVLAIDRNMTIEGIWRGRIGPSTLESITGRVFAQ